MTSLPSEVTMNQGQFLMSTLINFAIAATGTVLKRMMRSTNPMSFIIGYLGYQAAAEIWWSSGKQDSVRKEDFKLTILPECSMVLTDAILILTYNVAMRLARTGWWWELKDEDGSALVGNLVLTLAIALQLLWYIFFHGWNLRGGHNKVCRWILEHVKPMLKPFQWIQRLMEQVYNPKKARLRNKTSNRMKLLCLLAANVAQTEVVAITLASEKRQLSLRRQLHKYSDVRGYLQSTKVNPISEDMIRL